MKNILIILCLCCMNSIASAQADPFGGGKTEKAPAKKEQTPGQKAMEEKLKSIIIPNLEFQDASLKDALEFLKHSSAEHNDGKQINFIMVGIPDDLHLKVTMSVKSIPLFQCIRYISEITGTNYRIDEFAVAVGNVK